jgi:hypothetical protein
MVEGCLELNFLMNYYVMGSYPFFFFGSIMNGSKSIRIRKERKGGWMKRGWGWREKGEEERREEVG